MDGRWEGDLRFVWGGELFSFFVFLIFIDRRRERRRRRRTNKLTAYFSNTQNNSDIILASPKATFGLPEASRGLYAAAGGLSRLVRLAGMTLASEIALTGRNLSAAEALHHGIINRVSQTPASLVPEAIAVAEKMSELSPDAIIVTRHGLRESWELASVERASQSTDNRYGRALKEGENLKIGLRAFREKKKPKWVASKL